MKKQNLCSYVFSCILAGIFIGLAAAIYLRTGATIFSSLLFSLGLLFICFKGYHLFTGKVGTIKYTGIKCLYMLIMLIFNVFGAILVSSYFWVMTQDAAQLIIDARLSHTAAEHIIPAIGCGMLMWTAVKAFQTNKIFGLIAIPLCVIAFINSGFYHCIADAAYYAMAGDYMPFLHSRWWATVVGNTIGSLFLMYLNKIVETKKSDLL